MLDFADVVAINKFERRGAEDARRDVARQLVRNREAFGVAVGADAGLRHQRRPVQRRRRHRALPAPARPAGRRRAWPVGRGCAAAGRRPGVVRADQRGAAAARPVPRGDRRRRPRLRTPTTEAQAEVARRRQHLTHRGRAARRRRRRRRPGGVPRPPRPSCCPTCASCWTGGPRGSRRTPATSSSTRCADKEIRTPLDPRPRCRAAPVRRVSLPRTRDDAELLRFLRGGEPARRLPLHRRGLPVQARGRGARPGCSPARATRSAPTGASSCCPPAARRPGCRRRSTR